MSSDLKLTVWVTTYNHAPFIRTAIESVLAQVVNFEYDIVIGEDFSTDNTREIVKKLAADHPEKIKLLLPDHNLGMMGMFEASYKLCKGQYLAWLDGDDYWTDIHKLQLQVDYLDAHPEISLSFHNVMDRFEDTIYPPPTPCPEPVVILTLDDFLIDNRAASLSVVHRNILGPTLPSWMFSLPFPDLAFHLLLLKKGNGAFFQNVMGVYRIHKGGSWSWNSELAQEESTLDFYLKVMDKLGEENVRKIQNQIVTRYPKLVRLNLKANLNRRALKYAVKIFQQDKRRFSYGKLYVEVVSAFIRKYSKRLKFNLHL